MRIQVRSNQNIAPNSRIVPRIIFATAKNDIPSIATSTVSGVTSRTPRFSSWEYTLSPNV